jgi:MerR family redox-sensitive transcriptional activator SoxR
MGLLTISKVARQVGLQASAIRYYESIGLLPRALRVNGQRRYDETAIHQLAIIHRARQMGFTLSEIRHLFFGFRRVTRASERWRNLCRRKLTELDRSVDAIKALQNLLKRMMKNCGCETLDQCGKGIYRKGCSEPSPMTLPKSRRHPQPTFAAGP